MLTSLAPNIWLVAPKVPRYPYGNCLYVDDELPTVIDMGAGGNAFADVPKDIVKLGLISHFHFDHVHCDTLFPNIELRAGIEEMPTYLDEAEYTRFHGYDLWEELMHIPRELYGNVVGIPEDIPVRPGFRRIPIQKTFMDQEDIVIGRTPIKAIHLPGHSAGHYGFLLEEENILFSADIDLVASGPWYNSNSGDVGDLIASVQKIKEIGPRILVPSHRRVQTENIPENLDKYIQVVLNRENRIFELLAEPMTIDQLAEYRLMYPNRQNIYEHFWEKMTIRNHLKHLIRNGIVVEIEKGLFGRV